MSVIVPNKFLTSEAMSGRSGELGFCTAPNNEAIFLRNDGLSMVSFQPTQVLQSQIGNVDEYWRNMSHVTSLTDVVSEINDTAYWVANTFVRKGEVVYQTDGTTGLLGLNVDNKLSNNWQLTGLTLSGYTYLKCYVKMSNHVSGGTYLTPGVVIILPLDDEWLSQGVNGERMYIAGSTTTNPNDPDVHFAVLVAVDSTKTKFQVVSENSIAGTILGQRNGDGRYLYKITGHFD